ncbi:putative transporter (transmembrane protein) [Gillisia sp. Hel_I_86]|uniref:mechanosensitive ion channel n=1 Tax=Gillisia sp. Hel_I_86 TaxID=1249981 RepID=UPI00119A68C0|nr:mechanosensitive ion channel [Gillisia sp. Hel_I_86]TVZ25494.1 putative transporter (transmembrane protein) [Gillisia sp. Hel_I_86]
MENQLENFANQVSNFLPDLLGAILVLLVGWLVAKGIKALVVRLLRKTHWDERVFGRADVADTNVFLGNIFYYLVMIIVILIVLEILGIDQVLTPLENMVDEFLSFVPNIIGAILIGFIGYILAKFVANLVSIGGSFLDKMVDKTGFKDTDKLVNILKKVVFIIIFVPFLIQAFNALQLEAISEPANDILYGFTEMIGEIIIAALVLTIFIWGGKFLADFLEDLFKSLGLDTLAEKIQIHNMIGANQSLSKIVANLIYFFLVFFGIITAVEILGLDRLTEILNQILEVTGQIIFGLIILAIGNYISVIIYNTMTKSSNNNFIASIVRYASLALFIAIALRTMGIANEIVELAFGLILGALAVAFALSYGLGGREAAGEHFREVIQKFKNDDSPIKPDSGNPANPTSPQRNINDPANPNRRNTGSLDSDDRIDPSDPTLNL